MDNLKFNMSEGEREIARNSYLMSLAVFITTLPIPILNLMANFVFYLSHRKEKYELRWHCLNSFISQLPLFFINSGTWYLAWNILWDSIPFDNFAMAYFTIAATLNIGEIIISGIGAAKAYNDKTVDWLVISPMTHILCKKVSWDKWQRRWIETEEVFLEMKKKAKRRLICDLTIAVVGIAIMFIALMEADLVGKMNNPNPSFISLIESGINHSLQYKKFADGETNKAVKRMSEIIIANNSIDSVNIFVVRDKTVNAFAYCRKNIAVQSGLIAECESSDELMGVIAHEMAHLELRHVSDNVKESIGITLILGTLLGDFSNIAAELVTNKFSRESEEEADKTAIQYLHNAGVNPYGLVSFMEKIECEENKDLDFLTILSTHPATKDRIEYMKKSISELEAKEYKSAMREEEWKAFQEDAERERKER